jgi:hypothetical protein
MKPNFDVELLPEAIRFLDNLDDKAREKYITTSRKLNLQMTKNFFKNLMI